MTVKLLKTEKLIYKTKSFAPVKTTETMIKSSKLWIYINHVAHKADRGTEQVEKEVVVGRESRMAGELHL